MYCNQCGAEIENGKNFCTVCGAPLNKQGEVGNSRFTNSYSTYGQPQYARPVNNDEGRAAAKSVLTFGILSLAFALSFILSPLGIIFGGVAKSKNSAFIQKGGIPYGPSKTGSGLSTAGIIVGIIYSVLLVIYIVMFASIYSSVSTGHFYY